MQNRYLTGEERNPKTREEVREANRGSPLLTDLCLAMRSDPVGMIRGLGEVMTCVYGPAVTYAFPDPLVVAYRHSVVHVSLISILDGTALSWCRQEDLRAQMSETVLFGKVKDPELVVCNFRGQLQCTMGGKREGPMEVYPKFWNLNPVARDKREVLRIPAWTRSFKFLNYEKGIGNDNRAGCPPRFHPRVPEGEKNDHGNEQPPGSPFPIRESHGRKTAKRIHGWLGSFVHWILGSGVFPHV